ncbi:hypothetical protein M9Y10_014255 [Tritrichomonas musculus]|uniref:Uncharacterized protein n=1 Tax=Tritrichomonas musculus TaxID=1915356 RepID=A0ABR2L0Y6_9EUKA
MEEEEEYVSNDENYNYQIINPTHKLFLSLRDNFYSRIKPVPNKNKMEISSPLVFDAQLYQLSNDYLSIRSDIEILIRKKIIRCFNLNLSKYGTERYYMLEIDYVDQLRRMNDELVNNFLNFVINKSYISPTISTKTLELNHFSSKDISYLVNKKVLLLNTGKGQPYILSVPSSSSIIYSISNGRKHLVTYLNHQKNKIVEKFDVERQNIKDSIFYAEFHCQELLGIGVFEEIKISNRPSQIILKYDPYKAVE